MVGLLKIGQWAFFLLAGQVPELTTAPWSIGFHLAAEALTAVGLLLAGAGLLRGMSWAPRAYLFTGGMLVYSIVASAGYFAQTGQWGLVAMFGVLLALSLLSRPGLEWT